MKEFVKRNKTTLISVAVLIAIALLTIYTLFKDNGFAEVYEQAKTAVPGYLFLAVVCVFIYVIMQGVIIYIMLRASGQKAIFGHCLLLAFSGYFFCSITPFAIGGPTIQLYYMKKDEIAIPVSAAVILIFTFMYKVVLVFVGFGILIFGRSILLGELHDIWIWYGIGLFLTTGFCFLMAFFVFRTNLSKRLVIWFIKKLEKKRFLKPKEGRIDKVRAGMERYEHTAAYFKDHMPLTFLVFVLSVVQRFVLFSITYFVYRALGGIGYSIWRISLLQSVISLCVDLLPIPGGMGISELIFMSIFTGIFLPGTEVTGLVLSRGISYYVLLIVCAIVAVAAHFFFTRNRKKNAV